jgi:GxxExxY protein
MNADRSSRDDGPGAPGRMLQERLTRRVLRCYYEVYNELGPGFLESVYGNAMAIAFRDAGLEAFREAPISIRFRDETVGDFRADFLIERLVLVELKAVRVLDNVHAAQLLNYLRGSDVEVGLLLNFGPQPEFRRQVLSTSHRTIRAHPRKSAVHSQFGPGATTADDPGGRP